MKYEELKVGQWAEVSKTITEADIVMFAGITTDCNPIHLDEEYAKKTVFKRRIAHGILVSGLISSVLAGKLPGPGCIYMGQDLKFTAPVFIGDTITARVEITELRDDKKIVKLSTICTNQEGKEVIVGSAVVKHPV